MALIKTPKLKKAPSTEIKSVDYVEGRENLSKLSLEELAARYGDIDQQAQLMKGAILVEARKRFVSNLEFSQWVDSMRTLCSDTPQHRTRLMNLARFFENREIIGISLTACYEISAPINADIADKVYQAALNKNLSVAQIKAEIAKAKGLLPESVNEGSGEPELMPLEDISRFMEQVLADIGELPVNDAIRVLKECEKQLKKNSKTVSSVED
jgi:hypothetical protein